MESRIKKLEMIVQRLVLKHKKDRTHAMVTPYPISNNITGEEVSGAVLKYMFASRGIINKGLIRFDKKLKSGVRITVLIENDVDGQSKTYIANRRDMLIEPKFEVFSGDRLIVSVNPCDPDDGVLTEVWVAFTWTPQVGEATVKSFLVDKLLEIKAPEEN